MASSQSAAFLQKRARRKKRTSAMIAGVIAAGLAIWWWESSHSDQGSNTPLITAQATTGNLTESITSTGSVTAQTGAEVKIGSQITGTIQRLYADVGSYVKKGQPIALLQLPDVTAQLDQAKSNLAAAKTRMLQQESGVGMLQQQTTSAIQQAQAQLRSSEDKLAAAEAAEKQQLEQTSSDIDRAKSGVASAKAALNTAEATLNQTKAGANLQVANAQSAIIQAEATAQNAALSLAREKKLLLKGFVSQSDVDSAAATATVDNEAVTAAKQNISLVKQKVTADLQTSANQVAQAKQSVSSAQSALSAAQAEVYLNTSRKADVRDAEAAVNQARANLISVQANNTQNLLKQQDVLQAQEAVQAARDQVAYEQDQVDKTIIRTPISGTVLQLASQQGETLAAGLSAPTLIIVADLHRLQIDAYVDETDIGKVKLGQEADCTLDAFPNKVIKGHVAKIASGSTIQQGVVTYDVTIALDKQSKLLKPDMTANVTIQIAQKQNVLLVPSEAVHLAVHGATVDVLNMVNGKPVITHAHVVTGGSDGMNTIIKSGLTNGETIVRAGSLSSNQPMRGNNSPFTKATPKKKGK